MNHEATDRARDFLSENILGVESFMIEYEYALEQGVIPIRPNIKDEMQSQMSALHSLLAGVDTGAIVPIPEDDGFNFILYPEATDELNDAWAEVNEMLEESFILNNDEWYLYVVGG